MLKKIRNSNKAFTMVELIIVIAIIAVLAAVLAPQYLRFVEESKESHDLQIATQYMEAATVVMTDLSIGGHTSGTEWYVFKWGYATGPNDNLNAHMGTAPINASTGYPSMTDTQRDHDLQIYMAPMMGWEYGTNDIVPDSIDRPQSAITQESGNGGNSFIFYLNIRTGEILVDSSSAKWVNELGVKAQLIP